MQVPIVTEGFDEMPELREQLLDFLERECAGMTLAQARGWYEQAFLEAAS